MTSEIDGMKGANILTPSASLWCSPAMIVPKPGSDKLRFVCDFRAVNAITEPLTWPLPRVQDVTEVLGNSVYFTVLDCLKGFFQIPLTHPEDVERSAVQVPSGCFVHQRLPMGLKNSPLIYQMCMAQMLNGLNWSTCLSYLDDIIIPSRTFDEHLVRLGDVLERFIEYGITINLAKSHFCKKSVSYLGFTFSAGAYTPDSSCISSVINWSSPTNSKEVQSVLGFLNYFRDFVPEFARLGSPLYELAKKGVIFEWTPLCEHNFRQMIHLVCSEPVLRFPDYTKPFVLKCDASLTAIGALLAQVSDDQREHPLGYFSRTLKPAEKNYSVYDLEGLAIIESLRHFRHIVLGYSVAIHTDHKPLVNLMTCQHKSLRLAKWAIELEQYDLTVHYQPGKSPQHQVADALSRKSEDPTHAQETLNAIFSAKPDLPSFQATQQADPLLCTVLTFISSGQLPTNISDETRKYLAVNISSYTIKDGVLYFNQGGKLLLCVPDCARQSVLTSCHEGIFSAHRGVKKTKAIVSTKFHWPTLKADSREWVLSCVSCNKRKRPNRYTVLPLKPLEVEGPFYRVSFDITGPYPNSDNGSKYVIAFCDHFTRYILAAAIPNKTAETVAEAFLFNVVLTFGVPLTVLSDNAQEFVGQVMSELTKLLDIKHSLTSGYRPQTDGVSERWFGTLNTMLSHYLVGTKTTWDRVL